MAADESPAAQQALQWALAHLMAPPAPASLLHVVSVAHTVPFPVCPLPWVYCYVEYIDEAPVLVFSAPSTSPTDVCVCDLYRGPAE